MKKFAGDRDTELLIYRSGNVVWIDVSLKRDDSSTESILGVGLSKDSAAALAKELIRMQAETW